MIYTTFAALLLSAALICPPAAVSVTEPAAPPPADPPRIPVTVQVGGESFAPVSLTLPAYYQYDPRWEGMTLGETEETVHAVGCTVTCLAMSETYRRGLPVTPAEIVQNCDFDENACVCWPEGYRRQWGGDCLAAVSALLTRAIPVIVHARTLSGVSHWVIVTGFAGGDTLTPAAFTIHDPATVRRTTLADFFAAYPDYVKIAWYEGD